MTPLSWRAGAASYFRETAEGLKRRPAWARLSAACLLGFVIASPFSISLSQIFVFTAIGAWLVSLRLEGGAARFPLWKPFALFAALTLLSAALSDDPARSLVDAKQLFQILIFYCALNIASDEREGLRWVKALVAVSAAVSAYALAAALARPIGLDNRMSGFFSHYMTLGGYLTLAGALAFAYVAMARGAGSRWMGGAVALIVAALMTTFSRNAWLGFAAAALCATIAARSIRGGVILAVAVVLALVLSPSSVRERVLSIGNLEDPTVKERVYMWESGLNMVRDRPLLGTGLDMIKRTYARYAKPEALKKRTGHLHNNALHLAAERGVPALAAWLWIMGAFFLAAVRRLIGAASPEARFLATGGLAAVAGFFVAGLFEYNYGDSEVVMLAYFAMSLPFIGAEERGGAEGGGGAGAAGEGRGGAPISSG